MIWARMLAYITGTVDQELLLRNEYLAAENRVLRAKIKVAALRVRKVTLAELAHRLEDVPREPPGSHCCDGLFPSAKFDLWRSLLLLYSSMTAGGFCTSTSLDIRAVSGSPNN